MNKIETVEVSVSDKWNAVNTFNLTGPNKVEVTKDAQLTFEAIGVDSTRAASTLSHNKVTYAVKEGSEAYVSVDEETGVVTALEPGNPTIVATLMDGRNADVAKTAEFTFEVYEVSVTAITLNEHSVNLDNKDHPSVQLSATCTLSDTEAAAPSRGEMVYSTSNPAIATVSDTGLVEAVGVGTATITVTYTQYNVTDTCTVNNTIYAKTIQISCNKTAFYLDESVEITANVNPGQTTNDITWEYTDATGHTFVESQKKLTITCNNLDHDVTVKATIDGIESNEIELHPVEREIDFENGKAYVVGSSNYKTGVSKDAGALGSWSTAKYAFVFKDKTGKTDGLEYKGTITFRENDLWKIRANQSDWKEVSSESGHYKTTEGAFAAGQMSVTPDDDKNVKVLVAGTYDVYYAELNTGKYEVYVAEHGMKLSTTSVHAKLTDPATISKITVSDYDGTFECRDLVDDTIIGVQCDLTKNTVEITPKHVGNTTFKVCDNTKEIPVSVEVVAGSSAQSVNLYIRGTAANGWNEVSDDYALRVSSDPNNRGEILDCYLNAGSFKIANADWSQEWGYHFGDEIRVIGGAKNKFGPVEGSDDIRCNVAGLYNIYLTTNDYISIESVGGDEPDNLSSYYVRGTAVGSWDALPANQMALGEGNNRAVILGITLSIGEFKIANAGWTESWGFKYRNDDEQSDHDTVRGGAAANFEAAPGNDGNIKCNTAGVYDIYLTNDNYIYIEVHSSTPPTPVFSISATSTSIAVGETFNVTASNANGTFKADVTDDTIASVAVVGNVATITALLAGNTTIDFSDDDNNPIEFTLTVTAVPVFAISATSTSLTVGGTFEVTASHVNGTFKADVTDDSIASVNIVGNVATITALVAGNTTIEFSDDDNNPIVFTLTVNPIATRRQYIETKSWFNDNQEGEKVYVYAFKAGSNPVVQNAAFPGEEATWVKDIDDGKKIFYFDIPETYDTFIVVRVVGTSNSYQTVDITIADLEGDNCVYLNADAGSNAIPVGHYEYNPA